MPNWIPRARYIWNKPNWSNDICAKWCLYFTKFDFISFKKYFSFLYLYEGASSLQNIGNYPLRKNPRNSQETRQETVTLLHECFSLFKIVQMVPNRAKRVTNKFFLHSKLFCTHSLRAPDTFYKVDINKDFFIFIPLDHWKINLPTGKED